MDEEIEEEQMEQELFVEANNLIFRKSFTLIMLSLLESPKNKTGIYKDTFVTYAHLHKVIDVLQNLGLIEFQKNGREVVVKLTQPGEEVARRLKEIVEIIRKLPTNKGMK